MKKNKGENSLVNNLLKIIIILIGLFLQIFLLFFLYGATSTIAEYANIIFEIIKIVFVLSIIYKSQNNAYKIIWIILILFIPVLGVIAYLLWGNSKISKKMKKKIEAEKEKMDGLRFSFDIYKKIRNQKRKKEAIYLKTVTDYPMYYNDEIKYFETGELFYQKLKDDLMNAKKYILIEFYIVSDGKMWRELYEILKQKSNEGLDIYFIYDSLGSLLKKPKNLDQQLERINVKYLAFNPLTPFIRSYINYRDHRKIIVVDGLVAYTGGINIGDEYINLSSRLGNWKDCGVRITGEGVKTFIAVFFKFWNINGNRVDYSNLIDQVKVNNETDSFIVPYSDEPLNRNNPSEHTYANLINNAKKYVYITTPYLILDSEIEACLINASLSGVDVRIITPSVPDKKFVNACTKSFYGRLLESGIKIYEYSPGFIHSKIIVSDDCVANIGTANFDYRSFYLNYECGVWMYNTGEEIRIKDDFLDTINKSEEVKLNVWKKRKFEIKILEAILRVISPLL